GKGKAKVTEEQSESEESKKVVPGADEGGQGEGQVGPDPGVQAEGQMGSDAGAQDEGQAGSNPDEISEGQAGPDPDNARADVQSIPSPMVHAGSDSEHMDLDVADVSPQPSTEQLDEGFTATAYLKVQENLKLTVEEQVLLEDHASSSGALSSLQHLSKDISFGDLFFSDKPSEADNDKATAKTEVESMVSVTIQQDMSSIPPMTSQIIDLTSRPESPKVHQQFKATTIETTTTITTTLPPPPTQQQSTAEAMVMKHIGELEHIMANLIQVSEDVSEVVTDVVDWAMQAPLQNRFRDLPEADMNSRKTWLKHTRRRKRVASHQKRHMGLHLISHLLLHQRDHPELQELLELLDPPKCRHHHLHLHPPIKKVNLRQDWWKPLEEERPATPEPAWSISSSDVPVPTNNWASALASNYSPPPEDSLLAQTDDISTFMDGPALSISKMKAAYYPDVGLEQMVPDQFWIEEECKYDIAAMYGISHWWFQRQRFYIDRHTSKGDCNAVKTHMRILSVVRIEVFSMYRYDYMKKIVLRRADLNEHIIEERDFKRLPAWDRELPDSVKPHWDATGFEYKHDYTVIDSSRAVMFRDKYRVQMMMRFNEIHKFSDGTLQQIDEALDYRVKEFRINMMNPGLNTRFWTRKDVDRSKAFMFAIQKRLKIRRIFRNLESFVGGRAREGNYRLLKRTE
nr:hypothetical protein [Tanacetum cinerariifolium]